MDLKRIIKEELEDFDWIKQTSTPYIDLFNSTFGNELRLIGQLEDGQEQLDEIERILRSGWNASVSCMDDNGEVKLDKVEVENFVLLRNGPNGEVSGWRMLFTQYCHGIPMSYNAFKSGNQPIIYVKQPMNESEDFDWIKNPDPEISSDWSKWPLDTRERYKVWIDEANSQERDWFHDLLQGWGFEHISKTDWRIGEQWLLIIPRHMKYYSRSNRLSYNHQPAKTLSPTYLWTYKKHTQI